MIKKILGKETQNLVSDLVTLCSMPSVANANHDMTKVANFIKSKLIDLGFSVESYQTNHSSPYLVGKYQRKENKRTLLIYNHYDVQPVDPLNLWKNNPFKPTIDNGKIYARGVNDNKGNLMARIQAISSLLRKNNKLPINLIWVIEGEEEIGSPNLEEFSKKYSKIWQKADICLWENGGVDSTGTPILSLGMKGILFLELQSQFNKVDIHSGDAVLVESPVWKLINVLSTFYKDGRINIKGFYDNVLSPTKEELLLIQKSNLNLTKYCKEIGAERLLIDPKNKISALKKMYFDPTLNISGIFAGNTNPNEIKTVLPNIATVKIDIRLVPNQRPDEIFKKLEKHLIGHGFKDIKVKKMGHSEPAKTSIENIFVKKTINSLKKSYTKAPVIENISLYGGPLYYVASKFGIPAVQIGCGYPGSNAHAPNENLRIQDYINCIKATENFIKDIAK